MDGRIRWDQETHWLKAGIAGNGAFLNVNTPDGRVNPMTIAWGQVGIVWGRPIFSVFVRKSRYTYECLQSAQSFTVSVPRLGELADELALCGTKSGRDLDKVQACGLMLVPGRSVDTPILGQCGLHYECAIVARAQFEAPDFVSKTIHRKYESTDLHQITLGEILCAYITKGSANV
ncbi:flavin reductase [Candidatus Bipolaricaulota bacterium]|nr:flavin reductase [Candidatus Bipolaricaulota bacterium]TFH09535.1 MAG: flavin reductase family protein [Candidatus Atribacteria bacterium]